MSKQLKNTVISLRKQKNITQEEFAKVLGISRQTVIAIEKGNYIPSLLLGMRIARYFKKSVETVFNLS